MDDRHKTQSQLIAELAQLRAEMARLEAMNRQQRQIELERDQLLERERAAHAEADATRQLLHSILERVSDSFVALDTEWRFTYVNDKAAQTFGRRPEEMIGKHVWTEFPEGIGLPFYQAYYRAVETQQPIFFEAYYPPYDRWFENRVYPSADGLSIFFHDITEYKRAEERAAYQANLLSTVNDAIIATDMQFNIRYWNAAAQALYGWTEAEVLQQPMSKFIQNEYRGETREEVIRAVMDKGFWKGEVIQNRRDGTRLPILATVSLVKDALGKPVGFIAINRDITERKRVEDQLRLSEERFSKAFHASPAGMTITRIADGKFVDANESFCRMFEFSREEVVGHTSTELNMWTPEERSRLIQAQVKSSGLQDFELKARAKSGRIVNILFSSKQLELEGEPCLVTTMIDITERKQTEEALHRSEQILRLFVEHAPAAIAMFDRDMNYIAASRRYLMDYDLGEQPIVGRSHYDVFPEIPERWKEVHRRCLAGATEKAEADPFPRLSGKLDWIRWEIRPWYEANDAIGGIILFSEVITDRKQAQEEIRLSRDRLADLSRRLVDAHETEARALGRELHDQIGQMLTALKLIIEIAMQLPPDQARRKADQGKAIVDDLLTRVSALSLELRPPMLDDLGLLPALLWHVNRYQEQSGLQVEFKHSGVEHRRFDPRIETTAYRIVQESLTNVARHARATHVRLEVRVRDEWLNIQIVDDGQGFNSQTALAQHRGLNGMRERVQLVGGAFRLESESGQGTRLFIQLPLKENRA